MQQAAKLDRGKERKSRFTLEERFAYGNFEIAEVCELKGNRSPSGFYEDAQKGLVSIKKIGRKSVVPGPIAKRYIGGEPQLDDAVQGTAPDSRLSSSGDHSARPANTTVGRSMPVTDDKKVLVAS